MTPSQITLLREWHAAEKAADAAKLVIAKEQKLRKEVVSAFGVGGEGTQTIDLPDGWRLKVQLPLKREVDARLLSALRAPLEALHVSLDSLIDWKPALKTHEYRELTAEAKALFDTCVTTTPVAPSLELIPPKG
jgi:hypothetical protein